MSKEKAYVQATLFYDNALTTSWIPSEIARIGHQVKLQEEDGSWSVWRVVSKGERILTRKQVTVQEHMWKRYMSVTDD